MTPSARAQIAVSLVLLSSIAWTWGQTTDVVQIRSHRATVHLYGTPGGDPIVVSSGDGGWTHLGPHVADLLARHGFFVVGFDTKAYLEAFTTRTSVLRTTDEPGDYRVLADYAARGSAKKPILIGVSEGAGLSVLAAADPQTKTHVAGVVTLGLPDRNELGWRWRDDVIYVTHSEPNEPAFSAAAFVGQVTPLPLAAIQSTHDEFVPLSEARRTFALARPPGQLWVVDASNHRFSDNLVAFDRCLMEAIRWIAQNKPG